MDEKTQATDSSLDLILNSGIARALIDQKQITLDELKSAYQGKPLEGDSAGEWFVSSGLVGSSAMAYCVADHFGYPLLDLSQLDKSKLLDKKSRLGQATKGLDVFCLGSRGNKLFVGMVDPTDLSTLQQLKFRTQMQVDPIVVEQHKLSDLLQGSRDGRGTDPILLTEIPEEEKEEDKEAADSGIDDAPIVRFVQRVLGDAIRLGASDVHMEPYENQYRVRYRIDSVLQEAAEPPIAAKSKIAARIKIMCRLNTTETRVPQDGKLQIFVGGDRNKKIDFRVSTLPIMHGEKIVLRALNSDTNVLNIDKLGFNQTQKNLIQKALADPHGMILVTGPTGSGKTVSLYTFLSILNQKTVNISTVEDPCEIQLPGINQVSINDRVGLTFSKALRALLRQDPDIVMVGEIRDYETADISMKASQTGHLVLSTLHTNDAVATIVRLKNMGIELFNIAASVNLVIAQRLVRRLCSCKAPHTQGAEAAFQAGLITKEEADRADWTPFSAVGCDICNDTGYKGRVGIYEVMPVSDQLRELILDGAHDKTLEKQIRKEGVITMRRSGVEKIKDGITTIEEILGATKE